MNTNKDLNKILEAELGEISFGGFLRAARTLQGFTQAEMGSLLSISKSTVCDIEKGRQLVSIELAAKIARKCALSEELAVECCIRDALKKAKIKMKVNITKVS